MEQPLSYKVLVASLVLIVSCTGVGFWWGFNQGVRYWGVLDSVAFANISTAQVNRLQSGNPEDIDKVISLFDIYINSGIDSFYWYSENGNKYIGELFYKGYEASLVKSMKNIATYRMGNPEKDISSFLSGEAKESYIDKFVKREAVVEVMTEK